MGPEDTPRRAVPGAPVREGRLGRDARGAGARDASRRPLAEHTVFADRWFCVVAGATRSVVARGVLRPEETQ